MTEPLEAVTAGGQGAGSPSARGVLPDDLAGWAQFFARHDDIVLVANSDVVDMAALTAHFGKDALFVFFNKVYKVLDAPFAGRALLVARSSEAGANIVYRREVADVLRYFAPPGFAGVLNLRAASSERFSRAADFAGASAGFLDLSGYFRGFYPDDHIPSSGFALAVWLAEQRSQARIVLAGFSGQRSDSWKLFRIHDWTFEQIVQRLLLQAGRLGAVGGMTVESGLSRITERFPEIAASDVVLAASEILAERLDHSDGVIDGLLSATRWQRSLRRALRRLKPRTRKQRLASAQAETKGGTPSA